MAAHNFTWGEGKAVVADGAWAEGSRRGVTWPVRGGGGGLGSWAIAEAVMHLAQLCVWTTARVHGCSHKETLGSRSIAAVLLQQSSFAPCCLLGC